MRRVKEWFNAKAKAFVNKHVMSPINISIIEDHHSRIGDIQRQMNHVREVNYSLGSEIRDIRRLIFGYDEKDRRGNTVHISGLIESSRKQDAQIKEIREVISQVETLAKILPSFNTLATKDNVTDVLNRLLDHNKELSGRIGKLEADINDVSTKVRETILKEIGDYKNEDEQ